MRKHINRVIGHPLFSGSAIMIVGSNSASALNFLYHFVIARLLGPSSYGELVSLISVIGLLGIIPGIASLVIIKQVSSAKSKSEVSNLVIWFKTKMFIMSFILSLSILISSPLIFSFLHIKKITYLVLISIAFLFTLQSGFNRAILQGLLKFKEMIISILVENGAKLILSIFLIYIGFQIDGAMLAFVVSALLGLYFTNSYLRYDSPRILNFSPDINSILRFAIPVTIQTISVTSLYTTDIILVRHFFPSYDAGIYAALSTLGKIIFFATGPISAVIFPLVSQRKAKGEDSRKIFIYSFLATGLLTTGSLIMYWLFPNFVIKLLYGSAYQEAKKLLVWFGIFISLFALSSSLINYNLSLGKTKVAILPLIAAIIQIVLIILFHQTLFTVILISTIVTALLLLSLLIYSTYEDKFNLSDSSSL